MRQMGITTHIGCPMRCKFCPQDLLIEAYKKRGGNRYMSFEAFKTCINKLPHPTEVSFSGLAEAWLNSDCTKMLLYAFGLGHRITVYTTLVGMTMVDLLAIKHIPFHHFAIHLPDEEGYSKIPITDEYKTVLIEAMKIIPNHSLMSMGTVHHEFLPLLNREVLSGEKSMHSRAGNIPFLKTVKKTGMIECLSSGLKLDHNILLPNGDVLLCCMDFRMAYILGNLLERDYEDLFKGETFEKIQAGLIDGEVLCRYCCASTERKKNEG